MKRFELFDFNHQQSISEINEYLTSTKDYDKETITLIGWLLETDHNPYSIFHDMYDANGMSTSNGFAGLCNCIHHALVDDGDICFPVINNHPFISFKDKYDSNIQWFSESDLYRVERFGDKYGNNEVYFLKNVSEFITCY